MLDAGFNLLFKFNSLSWSKCKQLRSFCGYNINVIYSYFIIYLMNSVFI